MNYQKNYIKSALFEFQRYKSLGEKTFDQLDENKIFWKYEGKENSIAIIVKHLVGNMISRWTNFLNEDGEKSWRNRDGEFENTYTSKTEMIKEWEKGWQCLFNALASVNSENFHSKITIRNQSHTIFEAVNRQLAHYSYHVGQIVYIGKILKGDDWNSLSIPKGKSKEFNRQKFGE